MNLNKSDRVQISDNRTLWNDKIGIILSDISETDDLESYIKVKVFLDNEKSVIQTFQINQLTKINDSQINEQISLDTKESFIKYFLGKDCKFKGFDYDELYSKYEDDDGNYVFAESDLEYINYYKYLETLPCKIIKCCIADSFDSSTTIYDNFVSSFWDIEFENKDTLSAVCGEDIKVIGINWKKLNESLDTKVKEIDIIKPYLIEEDFDNKIESWIFASKIAYAENISESDLIILAKKFKHKVYQIITSNKVINIIAAKSISKDDVIEQYGKYLLGFESIKEI